jgi:hypothetical protein
MYAAFIFGTQDIACVIFELTKIAYFNNLANAAGAS